MTVSKRLRYEVLRRDNHTCRYCGGAAPDVKLRVDHVLPVALGGGDDPDNLVAACHDCNAGKSSVAANERIVTDVSAANRAWRLAIEEAARIQREPIEAERKACQAFGDRWGEWERHFERRVSAPPNWRDSIRAMVKSGLTAEDFPELLDVAMGQKHVSFEDVFRYFCGCAWKRCKERAELAEQIVATQSADERSGSDEPVHLGALLTRLAGGA